MRRAGRSGGPAPEKQWAVGGSGGTLEGMVEVEDFRALARSSRVLWRSVRFTMRDQPGSPWRRVWVRRPGAYRVEGLDGQLVSCGHDGPPVTAVGDWVVIEESDGRRAVPRASYRDPVPRTVFGWSQDGACVEPGTAQEALAAVAAPGVVLRADGLVARLADRWTDSVPMVENYRFVAMLDPVELADGDPYAAEEGGAAEEAGEAGEAEEAEEADELTGPPPPALDVGELSAVQHHGRPALEAVVRTLPEYEPRCSCCPLLNGAVAYGLESQAYGGPLPGLAEPGSAPDAHTFRVRLDRGTGIAVFVEPLDASRPRMGDTLLVRIEAVDEDMPDALFAGQSEEAAARIAPEG